MVKKLMCIIVNGHIYLLALQIVMKMGTQTT